MKVQYLLQLNQNSAFYIGLLLIFQLCNQEASGCTANFDVPEH